MNTEAPGVEFAPFVFAVNVKLHQTVAQLTYLYVALNQYGLLTLHL